MNREKAAVEEIIKKLETCGYTITPTGSRGYAVTGTNPTTGQSLDPGFIPAKLEARNVKAQIARLQKQGFDISRYDGIVQAEHARRLEEAQREEARLLQKAEAMRAAQQAKEAALAQAAREVAEFNRQEHAATLSRHAKRVSNVRFEVIELDASLAEAFLKLNTAWAPVGKDGERRRTNRPISQDQIDLWVRQMVDGHWVLIPHGIAVDWDNNLLDGQHRCLAVIKADKIKPGITVPMVVSWDWDPEVFDRLDQGRKRTHTDLLALQGETNRFHLSTAMRLAFRALNQPDRNGWKYAVAPHELDEFAAEQEKLAEVGGYPTLRETVNEGMSIAHGCRMLPSAAIAGLYLCRQAWPNLPLHKEFTEGLRIGYTIPAPGERLPLEAGDPRIALRNTLDSRNTARRQEIHLPLYIKAWRKWVLGERATVIRSVSASERFPLPPLGPGYMQNAA